MKKYGKIVLGGIQQKLFNLALYVIILMTAAFAAVLLYQYRNLGRIVQENSEEQKNSIKQISQETMDSVLSSAMRQGTSRDAAAADSIFASLKSQVQMMALCAEKILNDPEGRAAYPYALPDAAGNGTVSTQLLTEETADPEDPAVAAQLGLIAGMSETMEALFASSSVSSCYVALPSGVMLLADNRPGDKVNADGTMRHFAMTDRPWYTGAAQAGGIYFTDVERDVFTGSVSIMCSCPVYADGRLAAVVGADLFLTDLELELASRDGSGGAIIILNNNGHVIYSPLSLSDFTIQAAEQAADLRESANAGLAAVIRDGFQGLTEVRTVELDGKTYYMTGAPVRTVGWAVFSCVSKALTDLPTDRMLSQYDEISQEAVLRVRKDLAAGRTTMIILILVVLLLGGGAALFLARRIVRPLGIMTERIIALGGENLRFTMEKEYRTGDEVEALAEAFSELSGRTLDYVEQVRTVTAEKERIGTELALATRIQADMLPNIFPAFPERKEFDIYASMKPAKEVGGDFYDFFLIDEDHLGLVMADVSGKGVPAALFMMASKILIQNAAMSGKSPAEVLEKVNAQICSNNREEMFVTVWFGILDLKSGLLTAANAGHEYPVLKRPDGDFELVRDKHGFVIGGMEGMKYRNYELRMEPGAKLFLYTDGLPEATNEEEEAFGTERMLQALHEAENAAPQGVLREMGDSVEIFSAGAPQFDDLTMMCITYTGPAAQPEESSRTDRS